MKQRTLAMMTGFEQYTRKTRRALFLEEMEQVVPWRELCALVAPHYPKPGNGRPPVGVERMLRIYFLQQWFNLSDPAVEEALYDSAGMRQFVGIDLGCEPAQDCTQRYRYKDRIDELERAKNRTKSTVRSKVEHVFGVMKLKFGFVKLRYRGLKKNANQLFAVCALVNLNLVRKRLLLLSPA
jgi:IS5 family transposase